MTLDLAVAPPALSHGDVCAFIYREARLLDDRQYEDWLECYAPDVEYWMPAWTDDDDLTTDPQRQVSLIYYANRRGLEDRIYRLRTERSTASTPAARTAHFLANIELLSSDGDCVEVRYNWQTMSHRYQQTAQFFGTTFLTISISGGVPRIQKKKIVLKDDYIHQVIDIYHL